MAPRVGYQVVLQEHKIQIDAQSIARIHKVQPNLNIARRGTPSIAMASKVSKGLFCQGHEAPPAAVEDP